MAVAAVCRMEDRLCKATDKAAACRLAAVCSRTGPGVVNQHTYPLENLGYRTDARGVLAARSTNYTVNADGNVAMRGSDSLAYDQANRLTSATVNGTTSTDTYDGDGKRASQTVGSTTTNYVYDVNASLPNVLTDGPFKYVYGLGLAYAVDSSGNVQVYHTDGLGSVRAITDANGNLIQTYQTDEFGVPTSSQGTSSQPFQYTGQQVDPSGLVHLRARMYDPSTGRFLSRDPLLGSLAAPLSLNAFSYVLNNPVALIDPSGFSPSRVTRNGSTDNECFSSANGQLGGNVVFATCLDTSVGVVVYAVVRTPSGPAVVPIVVFAKPPKDSTGSGKDRLRGRSARQREKSLIRLLQRGMTLKQAADFQRLIEAVKKAEGRGGADNLGPDILRALRNQIVGGGNQ